MRALIQFFKGVQKGFKEFGTNISIIINSFLLAIVYFIGVGITSLFAKLIRKHFLDMKLSRIKKTYWSELNLEKQPIEEYYRQF